MNSTETLREVKIYEWPENGYVSILPAMRGATFFHVNPFGYSSWHEKVPTLSWDSRRRTMELWEGDDQAKPLEPKVLNRLRGFLLDLLDLTTDRPKHGRLSSLVQHDVDRRPWVPVPRWISDERWAGRYDEASLYVLRGGDGAPWISIAPDGSVYLEHIHGLEIGPPAFCDKGLWQALWRRDYTKETDNFQALVDGMLEVEHLLPESQRSAWEAEHAERGTFILPTPEEVAVFRMMGESLPLLWEKKQLDVWLSERRP